MSATIAAPLASRELRVRDDLNRESLPQTHRDPNRKVAWMNAICGSVLVVGVLLTKEPAAIAFSPQPIDTAPVVIPEFIPDNTPKVQQAEEQPDETTEPNLDTPALPTVVVADASKVTFAVEIKGPTVAAADYRYVPPPPRNPPSALPKPSAPAGPQIFHGTETDGGTYPKGAYPIDAQRRRETGEVRIYVAVTEEGLPEKVEVRIPSGSFTLDRDAVSWVKRWRWPKGGRREYIVPYEYRLN
jgi:TonB family protein